MTNMQDWKDILGALKGSPEMPEENSMVSGSNPESEPEVRKDKKLPKVKFFYEKKGRAGKPATILEGFAPTMTDEEIEDVARRLKQRMGCGGSARGGEILLQGDRRDEARRLLTEWGFKI